MRQSCALHRRLLGTAAIALVCVAIPAFSQEKRGKATSISGMTSHLNLKYLPPDRYSGNETSLRGDYELMRDPAPAWPGEAGGFSALSWDFAYHVSCGDAASPSVQQWAGKGAKPKAYDDIVKAGVRITITEMTAEKYAGQHVHVPPFFKKDTREASDALDLDGKPGKLLGDVIVDFFVRELQSPAARPPAPEIYPIPRIITGPTEVTMLAPRGATIHYTTDGSEPTTISPVYKAALTVNPGTTLRAVSAAPGMTPSGAARAQFVQGTPAPRVTGPEQLPEATTGQPYSVTFKSDKPTACWQMLGDLTPHVPWRQTDTVYPNNMKLDADNGVWSGTPTKPGIYWLQVWVNEGRGMVAGYRNYRWIVKGKDLGSASPAGETEDNNTELAVLRNWPAKNVAELVALLQKQDVRSISPATAGDEEFLLLVHKADRAKATALVMDYLKGKATLNITWRD